MAGATIGANCNIGQNVFIAGQVRVGNNVKIQNNVSLYDGCILEDDVFCGPSAVFTNVRNPRSAIVRKGQYASTYIEHGATIGANATIVCPIRIGRHAFIAAGAVATRDVVPYALMAGARRDAWDGSVATGFPCEKATTRRDRSGSARRAGNAIASQLPNVSNPACRTSRQTPVRPENRRRSPVTTTETAPAFQPNRVHCPRS